MIRFLALSLVSLFSFHSFAAISCKSVNLTDGFFAMDSKKLGTAALKFSLAKKPRPIISRDGTERDYGTYSVSVLSIFEDLGKMEGFLAHHNQVVLYEIDGMCHLIWISEKRSEASLFLEKRPDGAFSLGDPVWETESPEEEYILIPHKDEIIF